MDRESTMYVRLDGDNFTVVKSRRHFYKGRFPARTYDGFRQGSSEFVHVGDTGFTVVKTQREFLKMKISFIERMGIHIKTRLYLESNAVDRKMELLHKIVEFDKMEWTQTIDILPVFDDNAPVFDDNAPVFDTIEINIPEFDADDDNIPEYGTFGINIWDVSVAPDIRAVA